MSMTNYKDPLILVCLHIYLQKHVNYIIIIIWNITAETETYLNLEPL